MEVVGVATVTTDAEGTYEVEWIPTGTFDVIASKEGYSTASTIATVETKSTAVNSIFLTPLAPPVLVGPEGGIVSTEDPDGNVTALNIPADALIEETEITVTPLIGLQMPVLPPQDRKSIATTHLGPEGTTLGKPVTLSIQLPFISPAGTIFPVFSYDDSTNSWQETGIIGTVGLDEKTLTAEISHFSAYAVMPEVELDISEEEPVVVSEEYLSCEDTVYTVTYQNSVEIEDPGDVSETFIISLLEQHYGVSFFHPITYCETYYCSNPGSGSFPFGPQAAYAAKSNCKKVETWLTEGWSFGVKFYGKEDEVGVLFEIRYDKFEHKIEEYPCHDQGGN